MSKSYSQVVGMRLAKASAKDIEAAGELMALLNDISSGHYPIRNDDPEDTPNYFDEDDPAHLRMFYQRVSELLEKAPGFQSRIIGGMCYVILYDKNEIVDPNADTLELHPKLKAALQDAERYRFLRDHAFGQNGHLALLPPEEMDAAVDKAMEAS
jgi:hypothetical protein